jgi:hypothetical protein
VCVGHHPPHRIEREREVKRTDVRIRRWYEEIYGYKGLTRETLNNNKGKADTMGEGGFTLLLHSPRVVVVGCGCY